MHRFTIIDDGAAILFSRGVYRQAKIFHRGGEVYAAYGGGFIKLVGGGGTTAPTVSWHGVEGTGLTEGANGKPKFNI